jgi:hypothetical protein
MCKDALLLFTSSLLSFVWIAAAPPRCGAG